MMTGNKLIKKPVVLLETAHTKTMTASMRDDDLIQLVVQPGTSTTIDDIKAAVEAIGIVGKGLQYPLLVIAGKEATIGSDAMAYMAKPETDPYSIAEAYLISSISQKLLGNFYLSFNKPAKPTRIFTNQTEAENWLYGFLKK